MTLCPQCPWRTANHGKRHKFGFYRKANLIRLWNQIRRGGRPQGCHMTDPSHPDHVASGTPENAKPQECAGSVALVYRELAKIKAASGGAELTPEGMQRYLADPNNRRGLTKSGCFYFLIARVGFGGTPFGDGAWPKMSAAEIENPEIGLGPAA